MDNLTSDGIKLFLIGQTVVLSFIGCIILTIKVIAWFIRKFEKEPLAEPVAATHAPATPARDEDEAAAIAAAIHHRNRR